MVDGICAIHLLIYASIYTELIEIWLSEREIWGDGIFKDSILYPKEI